MHVSDGIDERIKTSNTFTGAFIECSFFSYLQINHITEMEVFLELKCWNCKLFFVFIDLSIRSFIWILIFIYFLWTIYFFWISKSNQKMNELFNLSHFNIRSLAIIFPISFPKSVNECLLRSFQCVAQKRY